MKKLLIAVLALAVMSLVGGPASAQTATANLNVTATVTASCSLSTTDVAFGTYDPIAVAPLMATGSVVANCTKGTGTLISINAGTNGTGSVNGRSMGGPLGSKLNYGLYQDASRTLVFGEGVQGLSIPPAPNSSPRTFTIYGKAPALQDVNAGAYNDSLVVTVNF